MKLNHVTAGDPASPALLLIPGQTESWWVYEAAIDILKESFQRWAVDLRGQGRSSRTPGRSFPQMGHAMHAQDPPLFAKTLTGWALALGGWYLQVSWTDTLYSLAAYMRCRGRGRYS
ncbi:MAG TPA: hypothetical protein VN694_11160 [Caulobacteraceae bacterium]|nr:hypothetical protein [Caulobacteraceae bacterium]